MSRQKQLTKAELAKIEADALAYYTNYSDSPSSLDECAFQEDVCALGVLRLLEERGQIMEAVGYDPEFDVPLVEFIERDTWTMQQVTLIEECAQYEGAIAVMEEIAEHYKDEPPGDHVPVREIGRQAQKLIDKVQTQLDTVRELLEMMTDDEKAREAWRKMIVRGLTEGDE